MGTVVTMSQSSGAPAPAPDGSGPTDAPGEERASDQQADEPARPPVRPPVRPGPTRPDRSRLPARPDLATTLRSPLEDVDEPMPPTLARSQFFWLAYFIAGAVVASVALFRADELREKLRTTVLEQQPDLTEESLERVVTASIAVAVGVLVLVLVFEVLMVVLTRQHGWARIPLVAFVVLSLPLLAVVAGVLSAGGPVYQDTILVGLVVQLVLVVIASVYMFAPSSTAWYRRRRERRRATAAAAAEASAAEATAGPAGP